MFCKEGSFSKHTWCVMCISTCVLCMDFFRKMSCASESPPSSFLFSWLFAVNFCLGVFLSYPSFLMCTTCCSSLFRNTSSVPQMHSSKMSLATLVEFLNHVTCQKIEIVLPLILCLTIYGSWCKAPWVDNPLDDSCVHEFSHIFFQKQAYIF